MRKRNRPSRLDLVPMMVKSQRAKNDSRLTPTRHEKRVIHWNKSMDKKNRSKAWRNTRRINAHECVVHKKASIHRIPFLLISTWSIRDWLSRGWSKASRRQYWRNIWKKERKSQPSSNPKPHPKRAFLRKMSNHRKMKKKRTRKENKKTKQKHADRTHWPHWTHSSQRYSWDTQTSWACPRGSTDTLLTGHPYQVKVHWTSRETWGETLHCEDD